MAEYNFFFFFLPVYWFLSKHRAHAHKNIIHFKFGARVVKKYEEQTAKAAKHTEYICAVL